MKRFLLFYGMDYYPSGGMKDFSGSYDSLESAKDYALELNSDNERYQWAHIYDTETDEIVWDAETH